METEQARLAERFRAMESRGLVHVGFTLDRERGTPRAEELCREVNGLLDAHEAGRSVPLDFGDASPQR